MLRPAYLQSGDKVALISPSAFVTPEAIEKAESLLHSWGLIPVRNEYLFSRHGQLAGTPKERLAEWQFSLNNDDIRAIWCAKGIYGALPIVEEADYSTFQGDPKWLIGMDDITVLHAKLNSLGIETIHSVMPDSLSDTAEESITLLKNFLFGKVSSYCLPPHPLNRMGLAEAEIIGGMLNWIHSLHATSIGHNVRGTILFIEENRDDIFDIERCILCLKYSGKLQHLHGVIVGDFEGKSLEFREHAYQIIRQALDEYDYPILFGFPAGHGQVNHPIILGANIEFAVNPEGGSIHFT